ncbi:SpoIID/LytB domain-containing protein [Nocardioides kribbensis]|uniref:SpoIID/LytB domain-containing protein n=1 Tax=Nocardioides kribbensis TaxID=305517 RepID=UPI00187A31DD|nr:SpoIID/LytB domain-containing protein [Nocardioides kribbensis]
MRHPRPARAHPARRLSGAGSLLSAALLSVALLSVALMSVALPTRGAAAEEGERRAPIGGVDLAGRGYGHGVGLSQWGAEGAARQGLGAQRILRFYYPGTGRGTVGGDVRVLLSADTSDDVVVSARRALTATGSAGSARTWRLAEARPEASRWRITAAADGDSLVSSQTSGGPWKRWRVLPGQAQFAAGGAPVRLHTPAGAVDYRGALRSAASGSGRDTVNVVALESYLRGVVPAEVIASTWDPDAIRAQAVAARTYAAFERAAAPGSRHYQLCDTAACQVYGGFSAEHPRADTAIRATARQVRTKDGKPIFAQFSASNGGWTRAGSFGYLRAKRDPYDPWRGNPYVPWPEGTVRISDEALERALPQIGELTGVEVTRRDGDGPRGGRVVEVRVSGTDASSTVSGDRFRSFFGLRSDWFWLV